MKVLFVVIFGLVANTAHSIENGYEVSVTDSNPPVLHVTPVGTPKYRFVGRECTLWILKKGTKMFHWNHPKEVTKMNEDGAYLEKDYAAFRKERAKISGESTPSFLDWGFYFSLDIWDSKGYGERLIVNTLAQDVMMLDPQRCTPGVPSHEDLLNLWELVGGNKIKELGIVGSRQSNTPNWLFTIDERATASLREAKLDDFLSYEGMGSQPRTVFDWAILDGRYSIKTNAWLATHEPTISKLIQHEELTPTDLEKLKQDSESVLNAAKPNSYPIVRDIESLVSSNSNISTELKKLKIWNEFISRLKVMAKEHNCSQYLEPKS